MEDFTKMMTDIGFANVDVSFSDASAMKKQLSAHTYLPI